MTISTRVKLATAFFCTTVYLCAQEPIPAAAPSGVIATPLDGKERMQEYLKSLIRPEAVFANILIAGYEEARNFPHEWGRTGTGFEKRLGSQYAQFFLDRTIELGFSAIHKEDNRYVRVGEGNFFKRFGNVLRSTVVVSNTQGGHTAALGQIAGAYGSWAIASQVWEPPSEQHGSRILLWGSVNLAAKGGFNLLKEFSPDLRKKHPVLLTPTAPAVP